jgi:hypothetical protein
VQAGATEAQTEISAVTAVTSLARRAGRKAELEHRAEVALWATVTSLLILRDTKSLRHGEVDACVARPAVADRAARCETERVDSGNVHERDALNAPRGRRTRTKLTGVLGAIPPWPGVDACAGLTECAIRSRPACAPYGLGRRAAGSEEGEEESDPQLPPGTEGTAQPGGREPGPGARAHAGRFRARARRNARFTKTGTISLR